jgi:preprotein translocase subunit Sec61beta
MFHLNDATFQKLMGHRLRPSDLDKIRRHVEKCRACARRLEEWRDNFAEVDRLFPELSLPIPAPTYTAGGIVVLPSGEEENRTRIDPRVVLWAGGFVLVLLAAVFGVSRWLAAPDEGVATVAGFPPPGPPEKSLPTVPLAEPDPGRVPGAAAPEAPIPAVNTEPLTSEPPPPPLPTSPRFSRSRFTEATQRLGGPLRLIAGLDYDHIETGEPSAAPGAQSRLLVVRVVYRAGDGGRILLDQQLIPADSSGFRPIEDPRLESGEPVFGTWPGGETVATWLDDGGYRLSLAVRAPVDSLKKLLSLVR